MSVYKTWAFRRSRHNTTHCIRAERSRKGYGSKGGRVIKKQNGVMGVREGQRDAEGGLWGKGGWGQRGYRREGKKGRQVEQLLQYGVITQGPNTLSVGI